MKFEVGDIVRSVHSGNLFLIVKLHSRAYRNYVAVYLSDTSRSTILTVYDVYKVF